MAQYNPATMCLIVFCDVTPWRSMQMQSKSMRKDSSKLEKVEYKDLDLCVFWLDDDVSSLAILTFRIHLLCHPADLEAPSHKVSVTPRRQKKAAKTAGKKKRLATKN